MSSGPSALTFAPQTFAKLSPSAYLHAHLSPQAGSDTPPTRPSNRRPNEFRPISINTSSLTHTNGSAVIRSGDTAVVCGVRAEILYARDIPRPPPDTSLSSSSSSLSPAQDRFSDGRRKRNQALESLGLLVPNLELSTGCARSHLPGSAPGSLAQSLSQRILRLLHISGILDLRDLEIRSGGGYPGVERDDQRQRDDNDGNGDAEDQEHDGVKAYWTLYIDTLVMSLDGNVFDTACAAIVAALKDTVLPAARWDPDSDSVICSPLKTDGRRLTLSCLPFASSFAVFEPEIGYGADPAPVSSAAGDKKESWLLADPDAFEEGLCDERVTVVVDGGSGDGLVVKIEKAGGAVVGLQEMRDLVEDAHRRWREWEKSLAVSSTSLGSK